MAAEWGWKWTISKLGVAQFKQYSIKFQIEPMETPVCHLAVIFDPDGNSITIHKRKAG